MVASEGGLEAVAAHDPVSVSAGASRDQSPSDISLVKNSALQRLPSRTPRGRNERGPNYFQVYAYGWPRCRLPPPSPGRAAGGTARVAVKSQHKIKVYMTS